MPHSVTDTPPPLPPSPPGRPHHTPLPVRKIILSIILAGSIMFTGLLLLGGALALMKEGTPVAHGRLISLVIRARHAVLRHIAPRHH